MSKQECNRRICDVKGCQFPPDCIEISEDDRKRKPDILWRGDGEAFARNKNGTYSMSSTKMAVPYEWTYEKLMETGKFSRFKPTPVIVEQSGGGGTGVDTNLPFTAESARKMMPRNKKCTAWQYFLKHIEPKIVIAALGDTGRIIIPIDKLYYTEITKLLSDRGFTISNSSCPGHIGISWD